MRVLSSLFLRACIVLHLAGFSAVAAAQAAAPASAPSLPAIRTPAAVANPYGLQAMWAQGDWVARITLFILAVMSLASWYVLISKLIAQSRMGGQARAANATFWKADTCLLYTSDAADE